MWAWVLGGAGCLPLYPYLPFLCGAVALCWPGSYGQDGEPGCHSQSMLGGMWVGTLERGGQQGYG